MAGSSRLTEGVHIRQFGFPLPTKLAHVMAAVVGVMAAIAARIRDEAVRHAMRPNMTRATMMTMTMSPMMVSLMSSHSVQHPEDDTRCNSIDNHLAAIQVMVVPAAMMMSFTGERRLNGESKHCQQGKYCQS